MLVMVEYRISSQYWVLRGMSFVLRDMFNAFSPIHLLHTTPLIRACGWLSQYARLLGRRIMVGSITRDQRGILKL